MTVTYDLKIDTADNETYAYNAGPDLLPWEFGRGRSDRIGIGEIGQLVATLSCPDGRYYLQNPARIAGLAIGRRVLLQAVCAGERIQKFAGRIMDIIPQLGPNGEPWRAELVVQDASVLLGTIEVSIPEIRPLPFSTLIHAALDAAAWSGQREVYTQGELASTGIVEEQTPYQVLSDVVAAEGGIFFIDGSGKAVYWGHRFRDSFRTTSELDLSELVASYGQEAPQVVTEVVVTGQSFGEVGPTVMWEHPNLPFPMKAKPANGRTIQMPLSAPVTRLEPLAAGVDYAAQVDDKEVKGHPNATNWIHITGPRLVNPTLAEVSIYSDGGAKNRRVRVTKLKVRGYVFQEGDIIEKRAP